MHSQTLFQWKRKRDKKDYRQGQTMLDIVKYLEFNIADNGCYYSAAFQLWCNLGDREQWSFHYVPWFFGRGVENASQENIVWCLGISSIQMATGLDSWWELYWNKNIISPLAGILWNCPLQHPLQLFPCKWRFLCRGICISKENKRKRGTTQKYQDEVAWHLPTCIKGG